MAIKNAFFTGFRKEGNLDIKKLQGFRLAVWCYSKIERNISRIISIRVENQKESFGFLFSII